jgi:Domain of unknown function (DUF4153)
MEGTTGSGIGARRGLPVILIAAIIQALALYGLHQALNTHRWPATNPSWLLGLYSVCVFVPVTIEMLAEYTRRSGFWFCAALLTAAYFYFGWHHGSLAGPPQDRDGDFGFFAFGWPMVILWLLALPFIQSRLGEGRWIPCYQLLFTSAWRNKLVLTEALLFTGGFWLLLFLWARLFHLLKIELFREIFGQPIFVFPATCLAFGLALHLIGSIDRLTSLILEQILNVLRWLALLAGIIVAVFTAALLFKVPLMLSGERSIGATLLLWLIAVMVLLLNAAYRDGFVQRPYPQWISLFLRLVQPLTVVVALTALYALATRIREYGLTVERVWAIVVAGTALCYTMGYSVCAARKGGWFAGMSRVNTVVALALIAVLCAALTPLMSPYRLAANSQYRLALQPRSAAESSRLPAGGVTPFQYLRFASGRYGRERLEELTKLQAGPDAERIRGLAQAALDQKTPWDQRTAPAETQEWVADLKVYPSGRTLDRELAAALIADVHADPAFAPHQPANRRAGLFVDLHGDGHDEFVLLGSEYSGLVYEKRANGWVKAGKLVAMGPFSPVADILDQLGSGNYGASVSEWRELRIGARKYAVADLQ